MSKVTEDGNELIKNGTKWVHIHSDQFDPSTVVMQIGLVRSDGIKEKFHATRKYFIKDGEVSFLTYPHC